MARQSKHFVDLFYPEPNTGCWLWGGAYNEHGYGKVGPIMHEGFHLAHRFSYHFYNGAYDRKLFVCHRCDNPACVNPQHLFLGSAIDNIIDRNKKGRTANGTNIPRAKLSIDNVRYIRQSKLSNIELGIMFNMRDGSIWKVRNRRNWKHV